MKVAACSFAQFVYPFLFEPDDLNARAGVVERAVWPGRERPLDVWARGSFPEDDLLLHIVRYLNPPPGTRPTAHLWEMDGNALRSPQGLGASAEWVLRARRDRIRFQLHTVSLALFHVGVGFVTVQAQPVSDEVDEWLDFLYSFRFVRGQRDIAVEAQRRTGREELRPFFPESAGGLTGHPDGSGVFGEVLDAALRTGAVEQGAERWWREVFVPGQLLPFAALYADAVPDEQIPRLLYQVRNFFPSDREIRPAPEDLRADQPALLHYAEKQWFALALEGAGFVACDAPPTDFFRREMPQHLRSQYFLLFLLALYQRFALMMLSQEIAEHWLRLEESEREPAFERIQDTLLDLTARGYSTQVMQRPHHNRVYRGLQEIFQLDRLYQEVGDGVREMYNTLLLRRARAQERSSHRLEVLVRILGATIGVPALLLGFLSINLRGITAAEGLLLLPALALGGGALAVGVLLGLVLPAIARSRMRP